MQLCPGLSPELEQKYFLADNYGFAISVSMEYSISKEETLDSLINYRDYAVENMRHLNFTQEQIKFVLKLAADEFENYFTQLGILPEQLY